ncbi:S8 family serine peptidase [Paenibacillus agri]|uniref:S8 family serine peptidase n=1 Tax=Paenibacillus agri TaxID=2744309 RepID=A0A850EI72_9BACL|nr:S8 family serine peptidase [Paenibacillus agri]NUU59114.1 S8 family serine peptidase [Paenibacillus agri]
MKLLFKSKLVNKEGKHAQKLIVLILAVVVLFTPFSSSSWALTSQTARVHELWMDQGDTGVVPPVTVTDFTYLPTTGDEAVLSGIRQSRLIIFKEGHFPEHAEELQDQFPQIEVTMLPEAGMLRLAGYSLPQLQQVEAELRRIYDESIEEVGEDPKIVVSDNNDNILEGFNVNGSNFMRMQTGSSAVKNTAPHMLNFLREAQTDSINDGSPLTAKAFLYQQWGWDIKEVTDDEQSLSVQIGNHDVVVAVVDSGIDTTHPDLSSNIVREGKSFVPGVTDTFDRIGHGTMVAGTIAANGRLLGVGPNLGLASYKVFDQGEADSSWVVEAIIQAVRDDVDVINLSLGTYKSLLKPDDQAILIAYSRAIAYAYLKGVVVVASSGTDGLDIGNPFRLAESKGWKNDLAVHAPGGLPGVITVAASNREHELAYYSNYGLRNMITAPAGDYGSTWFTKGELNLLSMCLTTYPTQLPQSFLSQLVGLPAGYEFMIGTSLAAPKVSAAAALLIAEGREKGIRMSPDIIQRMLFQNATDYGTNLGAGVVNVYRALKNIHK